MMHGQADIKCKSKDSYPVHAIKACGGRRVRTPLILNVRTEWGIDENIRCININCVMRACDFA